MVNLFKLDMEISQSEESQKVLAWGSKVVAFSSHHDTITSTSTPIVIDDDMERHNEIDILLHDNFKHNLRQVFSFSQVESSLVLINMNPENIEFILELNITGVDVYGSSGIIESEKIFKPSCLNVTFCEDI